MRRLVIVVLVLFGSLTLPLAATPAWATGGPDAPFARTYSGPAVALFATSVRQTTDGGFIVAGQTSSSIGLQTWLLRLDATGGILWQRSYGGETTCDICSSLTNVGSILGFFGFPQAVQTSDGGFVAESILNVSSHAVAARVFKVDSTGAIMWQEAFSGIGNATASSVDSTSDGGFILTGNTFASNATEEALVLRLDSAGGLIWQKVFGGLGNATVFSARQTSNGGFIVAGGTVRSNPRLTSAWLLALNPDGSVSWQKAYEQPGIFSFLTSVNRTLGGGFIASGVDIGIGGLVLQLNPSGDIISQKIYSNTVLLSAQQTSDGGFVVTGYAFSSGPPVTFSGLVIRLDSLGAIMRQRLASPSEFSFLLSVQQTIDGGFVAAGFNFSSGFGALVLKLNTRGEIHPCKILSRASLVVSDASSTTTVINGPGLVITSQPGVTSFASVDTGATSTVLCHHGFKP